MKLNGLLIGALVLISFGAKAQLITYTGLSNKYVYKINLVKNSDTTGYPRDSQDNLYIDSKINLYIFNKSKRLIQKISFTAGILFDSAYKDNKNSRSYITGKNKNADASDYDFGDLIIADLNFDGKEDVVVKRDSGGNGGPFYNFYIQGNNGRFYKENYLTTYVGSFPAYIEPKKKTITTQIHANVSQEGKKTFKYDIKTHKWHLIKWVMVDY